MTEVMWSILGPTGLPSFRLWIGLRSTLHVHLRPKLKGSPLLAAPPQLRGTRSNAQWPWLVTGPQSHPPWTAITSIGQTESCDQA